jgi:hypothetical protein
VIKATSAKIIAGLVSDARSAVYPQQDWGLALRVPGMRPPASEIVINLQGQVDIVEEVAPPMM